MKRRPAEQRPSRSFPRHCPQPLCQSANSEDIPSCVPLFLLFPPHLNSSSSSNASRACLCQDLPTIANRANLSALRSQCFPFTRLSSPIPRGLTPRLDLETSKTHRAHSPLGATCLNQQQQNPTSIIKQSESEKFSSESLLCTGEGRKTELEIPRFINSSSSRSTVSRKLLH